LTQFHVCFVTIAKPLLFKQAFRLFTFDCQMFTFC
jgi:hypothetical protein